MMIGNVRGRFTSFSGEIIAAPDFLDTSVTVSIDLASVSSGNDQRDETSVLPISWMLRAIPS